MYSLKPSLGITCSLLLLLSLLLSLLLPTALIAQGGGGFENNRSGNGFGGDGEKTKVLALYDLDKDGMLSLEERTTARVALENTQEKFDFSWADPVTPSATGLSLGFNDVDIYGDESLYDESVLRTIFMEFEDDNWEAELTAFYGSDVDVPVKITVDGKTYENVGVHYRGASSYMIIPDGSKRSLNLSFNFIDSDQRLLGYRTLNLLNAAGDPSFLRAVYYSHVAREYSPAPMLNYVRVVINGENWGIYLNAQQFNTDFAQDWFGTKKGKRWKVPGSPFVPAGLSYLGDNTDDYRSFYKIRSKDKEKTWDDFIEMTRVLNETPADELIAKLSPLLDIDGALRFLAVDMALVNTDGYWMRASDYSIYQDGQGRFHIIPHDMNEVLMNEDASFFGNGLDPNAELNPLAVINDPEKPLHSKLLAVPELRKRYLSYIQEIAETWLDWESVSPLLQDYQDLISADIDRDTKKIFSTEKFYTEFNDSSESIQHFMEERQAYLLSL